MSRSNVVIRSSFASLAFSGLMVLSLFSQDGVVGTKSITDYDPLTIDRKLSSVAPKDFQVHDKERGTELPIRVYLPERAEPRPVILFSHGLGGSSKGNRYCGEHWSARGYVTLFLQHPGSDTSVWKEAPLGKRMQAMNEAASAQNFASRNKDVLCVLNQLELWNRDSQHPFYNRLDLNHVGMSGHSFGAHTTQAIGGQSFPMVGNRYYDSRVKAALAMSPNVPARGELEKAFGDVPIPWMLMTGTKDSSPIGNTTPEQRTKVFPNLPKSIDRFQLILDEAEHSAFTDSAFSVDRTNRNPNHHRVILGLSTAFWDAYLTDNQDAKEWLFGQGAQKLLEPKDNWEASKANAK